MSQTYGTKWERNYIFIFTLRFSMRFHFGVWVFGFDLFQYRYDRNCVSSTTLLERKLKNRNVKDQSAIYYIVLNCKKTCKSLVYD